MLTRVTVVDGFVHVAVGCTDGSGGAADATWAEARFFWVSPLSGGLTPATSFGVDGVVVLSKQVNETGFYGAGVSLDLVEAGQYVVLFKALIGGTVSVGVEYLRVEGDPRVRCCVANAVYSNGSDTLTVNAWLVSDGQCVPVVLQCGFELFDDCGEVVFEELVSSEADDQGVFRLTRVGPGLAADRSYYGKVEIFDGFGVYSSLVGLVTVE